MNLYGLNCCLRMWTNAILNNWTILNSFLLYVSVVGVKLDIQTWMESFMNTTITPKVSAKSQLPVFLLTVVQVRRMIGNIASLIYPNGVSLAFA